MFSTAVCTRNPPPQEEQNSHFSWPESSLNPKNRIDSLSSKKTQRWTIDGSTTVGTRFFAYPDFARGKQPLHIDVFVPDIDQKPGYLRDALQPNTRMFVENSDVGNSHIGQHILRALEAWSEQWGWKDFEESYLNMPFGSRILIKNIEVEPRNMVIDLVPYYAVEQQMMTIEALQALWKLPAGSWPEALDIQEVRFVKQVHETISLVQLSKDDTRQIYVLKSLTDDLKPFYHELKTLLTLKHHPNIISRPSHIITKKCEFGGKTGICGFIIEYHIHGTLRDVLAQRASNNTLSFSDQLQWATQITSALLHIHESTSGDIFYTTLKPENIVMASSKSSHAALNAVLIDFELKLGPSCWNPPEVNYVDYLTSLAKNASMVSMKLKYADLLESARLLAPEMESKTYTMAKYKNPRYGYSHPWPTLTIRQREGAQVFGLGKLLWCLFENATLLNTAIGIRTFREGPADLEFPEFRHSPERIRLLIMRCTAGDGEWRGRGLPLTRRGTKIGVRGGNGNESEEDVRVAWRKWWREEIVDAERFVSARALGTLDDGDVWFWARQRPSLREVLEELQSMDNCF